MRKHLVLPLILVLVAGCALQTLGAKYTFDLSQGPVSFTYTSVGRYNPVTVTIDGRNGEAFASFTTDYYQSEAFVRDLGDLLFQKIGTITSVEVNAHSLDGQLEFVAETTDGTRFQVRAETSDGNITAMLNAGGGEGDTGDMPIRTNVKVDAEAGRLTIEDGSPGPNPNQLVSRTLGISPGQAGDLLRQYGTSTVLRGIRAAGAQNGRPPGPTPVGGAGAIPGTVGFGELSPGAVFDLYLQGVRYQGQLHNSTLYMQLLRPDTDDNIADMKVIITILKDLGDRQSVVVWDVFPFDYSQDCYMYPIRGLDPGDYEVVIDVSDIRTIRLPVEVRADGSVVPWSPQYEGFLDNSALHMRLYHPSNEEPIRDLSVRVALVAPPETSGSGRPEVLRMEAFPYSAEEDCYLYAIDAEDLGPGVYELHVDLGGLHEFTLPIIVDSEGKVHPGWQ